MKLKHDKLLLKIFSIRLKCAHTQCQLKERLEELSVYILKVLKIRYKRAPRKLFLIKGCLKVKLANLKV